MPLNGLREPLRFLAIGECMAELAPLEASDTYRLGFAGDTFNTAWYLRALRPDAEVRFFSRVGRDRLSDRMLEMMADAGVDTAFVARDAERSVGLYLISLDRGERSFTYWRDRAAARRLADEPAPLHRATDAATLVYFSGITLAILEGNGRRTLLDALARARDGGRTIVFDPNLRPRLWAGTADMTRAVMAAAEVSDVVLPSYDDEAAAFGDADPGATARRYTEAGARIVVVKNGADPVRYRFDGEAGEVAPPPVPEEVDTTAAGDSFNAGLLSGLAAGEAIEPAILAGSRLAGQVIGRKGALVPLT